MSSPATSCSRKYTDSASTYCSRKRLITIASRNDLIPRFSVYQLGRGSDPVIVVGITLPAVAFNRGGSPITRAQTVRANPRSYQKIGSKPQRHRESRSPTQSFAFQKSTLCVLGDPLCLSGFGSQRSQPASSCLR